jgi:hypothetical protein
MDYSGNTSAPPASITAIPNPSSGGDTPPVSLPQQEVSNLIATPVGINTGKVLLSWTPPDDPALEEVEITYYPTASFGNSETITVDKEIISLEIAANNTPHIGMPYAFTVKTVYTPDTKSAGVTVIAIPPDSNSPNPVVNLSADTAGNINGEEVTLSWTPPNDADFTGVEITFTSAVYGITQPITVPKEIISKKISGLTNGTQYTFTVKAVDYSGNTTSATTTATPTSFAIKINNDYELSLIGVDAVNYPLDEYYILTNDVTAINPIGSYATPFTGTFDGQGHTVTLNITGYSNVGLFSTVSGTTAVVQSVIVNGTITGFKQVGGIVGWAENGATILGCENKATIIISPTGPTAEGVNRDADGIGGIAGLITSGSKIIACKNSVSITGASGSYSNEIKSDAVGGICGSSNNSFITACYNTANITGNNFVGGILGKNNDTTTATACYNGGNVTATTVEPYPYPPNQSGSIMGMNISGPPSIIKCFRGGSSPSDSQSATGIPYGAYWETGNASVYWTQPITQSPKLYWED